MPDICTQQKTECYKCKMKVHWERVCRGKGLVSIVSLDNNFPSLACLGGPEITNVSSKINISPLKAAIDSSSCPTFINKNAAEKLKLVVSPRSKSVSLVDPTCKVQVIGEVVVDLTWTNLNTNVSPMLSLKKIFFRNTRK